MRSRFFFTAIVTLLSTIMTFSCAPASLNTTRQAEAQDAIFSGPYPPPLEKVEAYLDSFHTLNEIQRKLGPTNLTLRHDLIKSTAFKREPVHAFEDFDALYKEGRWLEGASYWFYTSWAIEWLRHPGFNLSLDTSYYRLAAPTGEIPLPEVRASLRFAPPQKSRDTLGGYYIFRRPGAYVLIATSKKAEPNNLHSHLEFGYFTVYENLTWHNRAPSYKGWDSSKPISEDGYTKTLPPFAVSPNAWRSNPPRLAYAQHDSTFIFRWCRGWLPCSSRRVEIAKGSVKVTDRWMLLFQDSREYPFEH